MVIPKTAKLVIELREDGKVYVTGQLDNKELCIAMLEEAKNAVNNWKKTTIVMPSVNELKLIKK